MNFKIKLIPINIISGLCILLVLLPTFVKGFTQTFYGSNTGLAMTLLVAIAFSTWICIRKKVEFYKIDLLWVGSLLFYLFWRNEEKYAWTYALLILTAFFVHYVARTNIKEITLLKNAVLIFSIIAVLITWLESIFPEIYDATVLQLFSSDTQMYIVNQRIYQSNLCGIAYHYSANAFYVLNGTLVLISNLLSTNNNYNKNKKIVYGLLIFIDFITLFVIGKRGHLLFLLITIFFTYMIIQPSLTKKMRSTLRIIIVFAIVAFIAFRYIPQAHHIIDRIISMFASEDVSNNRVGLYSIAMAGFLRSPIFGLGIGRFSEMTGYIYNGAHNDYMQLLCETGVVGTLIFVIADLTFFVMTFKRLKAIWKSNYDPEIKSIVLYSFMFQLFFLMYSFTGLPRFDYEINIIYVIICSIPFGVNSFNKDRKVLDS